MRKLDSKCLLPGAATSKPGKGEVKIQEPCPKPGVLVVDYDRLARIMIQLGLERNGFEVWAAVDGREAVPLYRKLKDQITVVLLDVSMPGQDGFAILEALRQLNPEVRVCFMTGESGDHQSAELKQRGAVYVIAKPFLLNELASMLRLLVQGVAVDQLTCQSN
jgi:CheY-like chemotaxis protein